MPQSQDQQSKRKWAGTSTPQQSDGSLGGISGEKQSPKSPVKNEKEKDKKTGGENKEKTGKGGNNKKRGGKGSQQNGEVVKDKTKDKKPSPKSDMSGASRRRSGEDDLDSWDPMKDDYNSPVFNSYSRPSVVELTTDFHGRNRDNHVPTGSQLYVSGIPKEMSDEGFRNLFQSVGPVKESRICVSRKEHLPFTFGFVTMNTTKDASRAIQQLNGYQMGNGLYLTVRIAEKEPPFKKGYTSAQNFQPSGRSFNNNYSKDGTYSRQDGLLSGDGRHQAEEEEPYQEDEEEGPYYEDIDARNLHREEEDDREIEESSYGHLKVHVRRSNSREYEENVGDRRRESRESGASRRKGGQGGHRSSGGRRDDGDYQHHTRGNSDDSDGVGRGSPNSRHSSRSGGKKSSSHSDYRDYGDRSLKPGMQLGWLEQQQVLQQLAVQLNVANSFMARMSLAYPQPGLLGPPMGLLAPVPVSVSAPTTASLEDITNLTSPTQGREVPEEKASPKGQKPKHTKVSSSVGSKVTKDTKEDSGSQSSHSEKDGEEKASSVKSEEGTTSAKTPVKQTSKDHNKAADLKVCINCGKPGTKRCSVCQSRYCSSKCQVDHWPKHQPNCKPVKAEEGTPPGKVSKDSPKDSSKSNVKQYSGIEVPIKDVQTVKPTKREMMVCVTYINSLSLFWIQIFTEDNAKQYEALENLMKKEFSAPSTQFQPVDPKVGHLYASGREGEDVWYRSEVLALPEGDKVHVHFSDFGDNDMVLVKKIRHLNKDMVKAPIQGVKCSLKGILPANKSSNWSNDANVRFESLALDHRLSVQFEKPNPKSDVVFITKMKDENGVDIFEELVKSGVAERKTRQESDRGTNKPSPSSNAKLGAKKMKDGHHGEGKVTLPDPVQKTLKINNSITVEITGINQSGQSFYGYMKESEDVLQKLQARLQDCYGDSQPTSGQRYQKGDYVVSRYSDGMWYRARILDAMPNSQTFRVMFVDYGAEEEKSAEDFRKMEPEFMQLAPQCLCLSLSGVSAMSVDDLKIFAAWVEGNNPCQGKVMKVSQDLIFIRLHVIGDSADCINEKLAPKETIPTSPKKADKPPQRTQEKSVTGPGGDSKSSRRKENKKKILSVGESHQIAVVDGKSPGKFYACLLKDEKDISHLSEELAEAYADSKPVQGFRPQIGQQCVAKFEGSWYRAEVKKVADGNQYEVFYLDYGNSSTVELDQCRPISPQFQEMTPFALCLGLENIPEECPQEYFTRFIEWVSKEGVMARIIGVAKEKYLVRLLRVGNEDESLNDILSGVNPRAPLPVSSLVSSVSLGTILDIAILSKQENPDLFYACLESQQEELSELHSEVQTAYSNQGENSKFRPEVGKVCCVRYVDGCFYRAVVGKSSGSTLQVLLLDYSDVAEVNISDCYPLEDKFMGTPAFALRFRLEASSEMTPDYLDKFQNLDKVGCKFEVTRKDGDVLVGIMWASDAPEEKFNGSSEDKKAVSTPSRKNAEPSTQSTKKADAKMDSPAVVKKEHSPAVTKNFLKASALAKPPLPQIGKLLPASVTFLDNPNLIYFHLCFAETLDIIKSTINDPDFVELKDSMEEYEPVKGELCMAYVVDQWCRAEVINISQASYNLSILDYGGEVTLSKKDLRPAPPTFLQTKLACVKCSLFGVKPLGKKKWSTSAKDFVRKELEEGQKIVQLKVMAVEEDVLQVDILIPSENNRHRLLSQKLIADGFATEMFVTTEPVVSIPHPPDNAELLVTVNGIISPGDFYCQVVDEDSLKMIQTLMGAISDFVSQSSADEDYQPEANQFCLGQFSEDQQWYRVQVVSLSGENQFKIQFIDFGNYETVPRTHLRPLPGHFVEPCALAFPCCLSGFETNACKDTEIEWITTAVTALSELTKQGMVPFKGAVKRTRDYRTVISLMDRETEKDLSEELIKMVGLPSKSTQSKSKTNQSSPTTRQTITTNGHPAATGQAAKPTPNVPNHSDSTMSELERLRAELEAREAENRRLKELLERKNTPFAQGGLRKAWIPYTRFSKQFNFDTPEAWEDTVVNLENRFKCSSGS